MFDRYVVGQNRPIGRTSFFMFLSVILVALLGIALIIYSFIHVERVAPPPLMVTFMSAAAPPPPPPPPPPPAGKKSTTPRVKTPIVQPKVADIHELVQPKEPEKQEDKDEGEEGGEEGGVEGGVKGGVAGGVVGGVVGGVLGGTGNVPAAPPPKPKNVPPHALDAQVLFHPEPHLPDIIKIQRKGTQPTFVAKVCIDQKGSVFQVNVLAGIAGADESLISTIKQWKYKPQPIPVCFVANFIFTIE